MCIVTVCGYLSDGVAAVRPPLSRRRRCVDGVDASTAATRPGAATRFPLVYAAGRRDAIAAISSM